MRRTSLLVTGTVVLAALAGCNNEQKQDQTAQLPPPPAPLEEPAGDPSAAYGYPGSAEMATNPSAFAVPTANQAPNPSATMRTYKVQKGDTLWSIAKREYNDGKRWADIAQANNITNERKLAVGMSIILP